MTARKLEQAQLQTGTSLGDLSREMPNRTILVHLIVSTHSSIG